MAVALGVFSGVISTNYPAPRQQVTTATTTAAGTRRSWSGRRYRLRLGALGIYAGLGIARIHSWQRLELGWSESTGMELAAVAGVREHAGTRLRCTRGPTSGCVGLSVAPGVCRRLKLEWRRTVAVRASSMVDGGVRIRRLA